MKNPTCYDCNVQTDIQRYDYTSCYVCPHCLKETDHQGMPVSDKPKHKSKKIQTIEPIKIPQLESYTDLADYFNQESINYNKKKK